jgi:hypothetical protein
VADFLKHVTDVDGPILATYHHRLNESRDLIVALEQRIAKLEQKLLDAEITRLLTDVAHE